MFNSRFFKNKSPVSRTDLQDKYYYKGLVWSISLKISFNCFYFYGIINLVNLSFNNKIFKMKKIKIFLFSFIFIFASFLAVGFYAFSPSISSAAVEDCASGTHWNGSLCSPGYVEIGTTCSDIVKFPDNPEFCIPTNTSLTCEIPINGSSCDVYAGFSWTTTNPQMPLPVIQSQANVQFSLAVRGGETLIGGTGYQNLVDAWGAWIIHIKHNMYGPQSQAFDATYDTKLLDSQTATSHCASGSVWDGTKCSPATFSATDCMIAPNQSTCLSTFDFKLNVNPFFSATPEGAPGYGWCMRYTNDVTSIKTSNGTVVYSSPPMAIGCDNLEDMYFNNVFQFIDEDKISNIGYSHSIKESRTPWRIVTFEKTLSHSINYGENSFSLYNNFGDPSTDSRSSQFYTVRGIREMVSVTPTATCTYGYRWDDTAKKCLLPADTFTINTCEIPLNESSCEAEVVWNVQKPAPEGITSLTISSPSGTTNFSSESGRQSFYLLGTASDIVITLKHNDLILASYNGVSAKCIAGTIWNFENRGNKCLLDTVPIDGWITATPCIIGGDTCQTTLKWRVWKNTGMGEEALPVDSAKMPTITLYENNNPVSVAGYDLITKGTNPYGDFMFDVGTKTLVGATSFGNTGTNTFSTAKYTLPDVGIDYSPEVPAGVVNPTKIKTRSATFRLGVKYDILENQLTSTYDADLGSVTVNAVCATGSEWNDVTNKCMAICPSGSHRSRITNQCVPLTVILTPVDLITEVTILTETNWFSKFVGNIVSRISGKRTTSVLKAGTGVKINWNIDNTLNLIGLENVQCTDSNGKTYDKGIINQEIKVYPSSTTTYSVTCKDQ